MKNRRANTNFAPGVTSPKLDTSVGGLIPLIHMSEDQKRQVLKNTDQDIVEIGNGIIRKQVVVSPSFKKLPQIKAKFVLMNS